MFYFLICGIVWKNSKECYILQIDLFRIFCAIHFLWVMPKFATYDKALGSKEYTWKEWDTLSELKELQLNKESLPEF